MGGAPIQTRQDFQPQQDSNEGHSLHGYGIGFNIAVDLFIEKSSRELLTLPFKKPFSNHVAVSHCCGFLGLSSSYLLQPDHDTRG